MMHRYLCRYSSSLNLLMRIVQCSILRFKTTFFSSMTIHTYVINDNNLFIYLLSNISFCTKINEVNNPFE